jgi:uncharacterized membrane protein YeiH
MRHGERTVVTAGGLLLLDLFFFPWHRLEVVGLLGGDSTRTAIQDPNALQGTIAFLLLVGMVAQVIMARSSSVRANPNLVKLQPAAGMAVFAMLAWKLAIDLSDLSVGAYLGVILGVIVAYGGLALERNWSAPPWKK